jgi:hypothetical protein
MVVVMIKYQYQCNTFYFEAWVLKWGAGEDRDSGKENSSLVKGG